MKISLFLALVLSLLTSFINPGISQKGPEVLNIGSRRELFVDHFLIDRMENTRLILHHPVDRGEVLKFDNPWEGPFCGYCTVIFTGEKYQLFYRGLPTAGKDGSAAEVTCYAESRNGFHWNKPDLGIFEISGSRKNNVILANAAPATHNFSPFLDVRPGVPSDQKYKALGGIQKSGLLAFVSPDGIHWKKLQEKPVFRQSGGAFDSQNVSFWSQTENRYLCYFRSWKKLGNTRYRSISRTTSNDFIHWSEPTEMDFGNTPREQLYTNQTHAYFRAPHIYLSIAARFMPHRQVLTAEQASRLGVDPKYFKDCSDAIFMVSRGNNQYERTFMEGFIRPGIGLDNWVSRSNYPALNVVQTGPTEMSIYLNQDYAQPTAHLHRYTLRLDGFISLNAPYRGGQMITKPIIFRGNNLFINFSTSAAGEIRVEIQSENGEAIPGYSLLDACPLIGNEIEKMVNWKSGSNLDKLAGKPIRLKFVMKDADVYSLRFGE